MESFKRFGKMMGLGAGLAAGSPEMAMAQDPNSTPDHHEVYSATTDWSKIGSDAETQLKSAKSADEARGIVFHAYKLLQKDFYFPEGVDPTSPKVRSEAEAQQIVAATDKIEALMKTVDAKYALGEQNETDSANVKDQLADIRLKANRSASPLFQQQVESLK